VGLRLSDRWVWDFWLVPTGGDHHLFYLQAPRSLADPERRHWHVSIGHAVSTDLVRWDVLPDALVPGPSGSWDDFTVWTGSIVEYEGRWHLLYTGTNRRERGLVQRVGVATSDDLVSWRRTVDSPVLEADPRWYELLDLEVWHDQAWRDPCVVRHSDGSFHALLTARARGGEPAARGVIGRARSLDLVRWEVLPPVTSPMGFGQMEIPQLVAVSGHVYLLFSAERSAADSGLRSCGTYYLCGDSIDGPFPADTLGVLAADQRGSTYGGKLVDMDGELLFLAWENVAADGRFVGAIGEPQPAAIDSGGRLLLDGRPDLREFVA
jgi:beta-fructofuranosidase